MVLRHFRFGTDHHCLNRYVPNERQELFSWTWMEICFGGFGGANCRTGIIVLRIFEIEK